MTALIGILQKYGHHFKNPITIADADKPDQPLVYVNDKFTLLTQYNSEEVIGKNCRFLQGPETNRDTVRLIREGISQRQHLCDDILNYRKDGSIFYNRLVLLPYKSIYLGLQNEIPRESFQAFNNREDQVLRDKALNALTILYLTVITSKEDELTISKKLEPVFDRIHKFIMDL